MAVFILICRMMADQAAISWVVLVFIDDTINQIKPGQPILTK